MIFEDVRVPVANRLSDEGMGFKIAMAGLDGGRINIGACSLGGAQAALDKALAYADDRKAFGKRIADFQALQFKLADMATELEAARTFLWRAASALDAKALDATKLCAMAKRVATDTGFEVANDALQIHGGYGYLADYGIEKIVRDLRVHQILEGTNEIMRLIVARESGGTRQPMNFKRWAGPSRPHPRRTGRSVSKEDSVPSGTSFETQTASAPQDEG